MLKQVCLWFEKMPDAPQLSVFTENMQREKISVKNCSGITDSAGIRKVTEGMEAQSSLLITDRAEAEETVGRFPLAGYGLAYRGRAKYVLDNLGEISAEDVRLIHARYTGNPYEIAETDRLIIREMTPQDLEAMYELYASLADCPYVERLYPWEQELEFTRNYIRDMYGFYQYGLWLLWDKKSGRLVGRAGIENRMIDGVLCRELGYLIGREWQRQGYGYEASCAILQYAFETLGLDALYLCVDEKNIPSAALGKKLGFLPYALDVDGKNLYRITNQMYYKSNA